MKAPEHLSRSPYVIGTGIGLLNVFAMASAGRGLGITTAFESAAALTERKLAPDATAINEARMAKGCTSGHGLTGAMQLAVSSWVFTPLMFATAAATARLLYGKEAR